ncbi:hypothetical protein VPHK225_0040 [Vibrio phage K225]|nr:hypothetical protein PODOV044v1_p0038 [Vibrio phage 23E28.1]QZI92052.1 hypothetical protein PODOV045v1_p0010 [Vibrio phage 69E27.1]
MQFPLEAMVGRRILRRANGAKFHRSSRHDTMYTYGSKPKILEDIVVRIGSCPPLYKYNRD